MAGYKETPRQKMIGMMYLVLTALLALNVSKQILDGFLLVNESMENTNENFSKKLNNTLAQFKMQYQLNENKVKPYWEKAQKANQYSQELIKYVDSIKYVLIMKTEGLPSMEEARKKTLKTVNKLDNYEVGTHFFTGGAPDASKGEARILRKKIEEYKEKMLSLVEPEARANIKFGIDTKADYYNRDGQKLNWEMYNFYRTILAANVTILNEIKAEVNNAQFDIVNHLYSAIDAQNFKFDKIAAKVVPNSRFIFSGEQYEAEIIVAAYDSKNNPKIRYILGADTILPGNLANAKEHTGENGIGILKFPTSAEGPQRYAGFVEIVTPSGELKQYHFHDQYMVSKPAISISPTAMNVFYKAVDNPVTITVPGGAEKIEPKLTFGSIRKDGNNWIVNIPPSGAPNRVTLTVNATYDGKSKTMGAMEFRVKEIPPPMVTLANKSDGPLQRSMIQASPVLACLPPVGFDFNISFTVVSYTFQIVGSGGFGESIKVEGNRLDKKVLDPILNAKKNQRIWFEDIMVKGPSGTIKLPYSLSFKLL